MKYIFVGFFSVVLLLLIQACSNTTSPTKTDMPTPATSPSLAASITLNKAHFKNKFFTEIDTKKNTITISTINGFHKKPRNNANVSANNYITALINNTTGKVTYQVNSLIKYKDHDKHLYKEVSYNSDTGYKTKEASILSHDISCLGSSYSGCIHTEHATFTIESTLIENIAASYTEGTKNKWHYKLTPKKGRSYSAYLFFSEIAALVEAANKKSYNLMSKQPN